MPGIKTTQILTLLVLMSSCVHKGMFQTNAVYYVAPNESLCPHNMTPCFDINFYVQNASMYFVSNVTFIFLPGTHHLSAEGLVSIQDVQQLYLIGSNNFTNSSVADDVKNYSFVPYEDDDTITYLESQATIACTGVSGFLFCDVTDLHVINLTILNCGASSTNSYASIHLVNVSNLLMEGVTIKNSTGYGLLGMNVLGQSNITSSSFIGNNQIIKDAYTQNEVILKCNDNQTSITTYVHDNSLPCKACGGNLNIEYSDPIHNTTNTHHLLLSNLIFSLGIEGSCLVCQTGTGLSLMMSQSSYSVKADIFGTTSYRNQGPFGANYYFSVVSNSPVAIIDAHSKLGMSYEGSLYYNLSNITSSYSNNTPILSISTSSFECNYGFVGSMVIKSQSIPVLPIIVVEDSTFWNDTSISGTSIVIGSITHMSTSIITCRFGLLQLDDNDGYVHIYISVPTKQQLYMNNSFLINAMLVPESIDIYVTNSTFYHSLVLATWCNITCIGNVIFQDTFFTSNGGAISLYSSVLVISAHANVTFMGNHASNGGALYLDPKSTIYLTSPCNVSFINNTAFIDGGAIYVYDLPPSPFTKPSCFFQINDNLNPIKRPELEVHIYFENNYAHEAGSVLYGGMINNCILDCDLNNNHVCSQPSGEVFNAITEIGYHDTSTSIISSEATVICYCDNTMPLNCSNAMMQPISVHPGETIYIPLLTLGQRKGISPSIAYNYYYEGSVATIISTVRTANHCDIYNISYPKSTGWYEQMITVDNLFAFQTPINTKSLRIRVLPCPPGFELQNDPFKCVCHDLLQSHGLTCAIETKVFSWTSGQKWIGIEGGHNLSLTDDCPFDYCEDIQNISLDDLYHDGHCKYNRCGVMCGQCCYSNYSMLLGSSSCDVCSNNYLVLLIPFAIMGVALVIFLVAFNFTVSNGTINGLILYAFVIKLNDDIFLKSDCTEHSVNAITEVFSIFISWLNLDLGIETCFYNGMDSIGKTWLQFAFPAYVALIIGVIIIAGKISTTISRLCRYHIVPVIGTLILLFYSKMLRVAVTIFTPRYKYTSKDDFQLVWLYDGNRQYLDDEGHISVFIIGSMVTVFFIIPYTILLPLTPYLVKVSHWRAFNWINQMKPLVDCYEAPFKDRYRFWTGAMLLYRIALSILSTLFSQQPSVILLTIIVTHVAIVILSGFTIYKSWFTSAVESFLHISIVINSVVLSILNPNSHKCTSMEATDACASVALVCFFAVLVHNGYMQLRKCRQRNLEPVSVNQRESPKESGEEEGASYREALLRTNY